MREKKAQKIEQEGLAYFNLHAKKRKEWDRGNV